MIKYQLGCSCGHEFETWFASSAAFGEQRARGLLACPVCGATTVEKRPMAPAIVKGAGVRPSKTAEPQETCAEADTSPSLQDAQMRTFADALREMRAHIEAKSENVGRRFADEARAMHHGDSAERPIHGEATIEEAVSLDEDGVPFGVVPRFPEDHN